MNRPQKVGILGTLIVASVIGGSVSSSPSVYNTSRLSQPLQSTEPRPEERVVISGEVVGEGYWVGNHRLVIEGLGDSKGRYYFENRGPKWDDSLDKIINLGDSVTIVVPKTDMPSDTFTPIPINRDNFTRIERGVSLHRPHFYGIYSPSNFKFISN